MSLGHGANIIKDSLLYYYDFANIKSYNPANPGTVNTLLSESLQDGIVAGSPTITNGVALFDGVDDQITSTSTSFSGDQQFTLDIFWKPTSFAGSRKWLIVVGSYVIGNLHLIYTGTSFQFGEWSGTQTSPTTMTTLDQWYHCVLVNDTVNLTCYVNGEIDDQVPSGPFNFSNANLSISVPSGSESRFFGELGTIRLYNRALTTEEVSNNFNAQRGRYNI